MIRRWLCVLHAWLWASFSETEDRTVEPEDCFDPWCGYAEPHAHGFACDSDCAMCAGQGDYSE